LREYILKKKKKIDLFGGAHDHRHRVVVLQHVEELFCYVVITEGVFQAAQA
jgi:hypothetical protein